MAVDAHAVLIELLAGLSLPVEDGGGQQFSCRCCVRHGQLEFPRHKTPDSSLDGLRDPLVLWENSSITIEPSQTGVPFF